MWFQGCCSLILWWMIIVCSNKFLIMWSLMANCYFTFESTLYRSLITNMSSLRLIALSIQFFCRMSIRRTACSSNSLFTTTLGETTGNKIILLIKLRYYIIKSINIVLYYIIVLLDCILYCFNTSYNIFVKLYKIFVISYYDIILM